MEEFSITIFGNECETSDDNWDVEVCLRDGTRYGATFFTLRNVAALLKKSAETGEYAAGTYFWADHPIIVHSLSRGVVEVTVRKLMEDQEFTKAFGLLTEEHTEER